MLVPRSYKYSSSPPKDPFDEKTPRRNVRKVPSTHKPNGNGVSAVNITPQSTTMPTRPSPPVKATTEPMPIPSKPVNVPVPDRARKAGSRTMGATEGRALRRKQSTPTKHNADAVPPAVAALLAMTTIPRPRASQFKRRTSSSRSISIDELVSEWKSDDSPGRSFGSSPSLHVLLEDLDMLEPRSASSPEARQPNKEYLHIRSTSSESVPSLEADDRSMLSLGSPSTPGSLRSRRSYTNLRKDSPRSLPARGEDAGTNHPLISPPAADEEDDLAISSSASRSATPKPRFSFKSNLTTSLQALKSAALSSLSSLKSLPAAPAANGRQLPRASAYPMADDMLWSHPFLFPRFSPEVRPDIRGTPTEAQRRYLNPTPLTFEEQEAPFQQALHAPFLAEELGDDVPTIQLQTYSRGGKARGRSVAGKPDPNSEAGRASGIAAATARQREPRENSDFLRVVVLEMNMRREGKLEMGRARIWLPPRQEVDGEQQVAGSKSVPKRWVGVSAN